MNKKLVVNKGYTLTVVSWENDGDYYDTNFVTVDSLEKAEALFNLMLLCKSKNNNPNGVIKLGNTGNEGFYEKQVELLYNFFKNNPILLTKSLENKDFKDDDYEDYITDLFYQVVDGLLGNSEYCICRVMESCIITYSPEDIYNLIIFES